MGYLGGFAGATLGYIVGDVPGAALGYKLGSSAGKFLPQNKSMDSGYGSRKRKMSNSGPQRASKLVKFNRASASSARLSRPAFLNRLGYKIGRNGRPIRKATKRGGKRKVAKRSAFSVKSGVYTGKGARTKKNKQTTESRCLSQGYLKTIEQYGSVNDPDCVYLTHSTAYLIELASTINCALLRKILTKAGFKITSTNTELSVSLPAVGSEALSKSDGLKFVYTCKDQATNVYRVYEYDTLDNQNFNSLCYLWTDMTNRLIDYFRNDGTTFEPYKLAVFRKDFTLTTPSWNLGAEMYLEDCNIEIHMMSNLVIQNRTLASLDTVGTALDQILSDRIDAQPLKGYVYEFKNADPRVKNSALSKPFALEFQNILWGSIRDTGMRLIRGNEYTGNVAGSTTWAGATEPFVPQYFANCTKSAKILLQPGEMKKFSFNWNLKGKIVNVIKKLRVTKWDTTSSNISGMSGHSQMIALEEVMRTPSVNKVTVGYERELKLGVIIHAGWKQAPIESPVVAESFSNIL